ncbi:MAG: MBL fold metallo-hydrolase [Chloroflexi bacterium]|nr:MBL fold metallo-hydrolase [Chloroflexota bacterium]
MRLIEGVHLVGSGEMRLSEAHDGHVYLLDCGSELALVDCGAGLDIRPLLANLRADGFDPVDIGYILLTHAHADHAGGCRALKEIGGAEVLCSAYEGRLLAEGSDEELGLNVARRAGIYPPDYVYRHVTPDRIVEHGQLLTLGRCEVQVLIVPGHSPAAACFLVTLGGRRILFSGDTVFHRGTIGLGNWAGSSLGAYRRFIGRLSGLGVDVLLPGHFMWALAGGQEHLDAAVRNLEEAWVPPAWQHYHPHR